MAANDDIPELKTEDDDEPMAQAVMEQYAMESDDESEAGSPGAGPDTPRPDDGPELEKPSAKRSRLSRITAIQNLCKLEKLKGGNDERDHQTAGQEPQV